MRTLLPNACLLALLAASSIECQYYRLPALLEHGRGGGRYSGKQEWQSYVDIEGHDGTFKVPTLLCEHYLVLACHGTQYQHCSAQTPLHSTLPSASTILCVAGCRLMTSRRFPRVQGRASTGSRVSRCVHAHMHAQAQGRMHRCTQGRAQSGGQSG